jgi:hypothetical protein
MHSANLNKRDVREVRMREPMDRNQIEAAVRASLPAGNAISETSYASTRRSDADTNVSIDTQKGPPNVAGSRHIAGLAFQASP